MVTSLLVKVDGPYMVTSCCLLSYTTWICEVETCVHPQIFVFEGAMKKLMMLIKTSYVHSSKFQQFTKKLSWLHLAYCFTLG
jgi:hypothetical protein